MTLSYSTDIVIFGGGIAGLWLLNRLHKEGYQAILLESQSLGGGQTIASQGIIHGGLKYALSGSLTGAANAIANMPARWRQCLAGEGDVDLSGVKVLSEHYYMWSESGFRSKLKTFLGSKSLHGKVSAVPEAEYPAFFKQATIDGTLYRLPDFVIDTASLIAELVAMQRDAIYQVDPGAIEFVRDADANIVAVEIQQAQECIRIGAQRVVLCAGEGNQQLIESAGLKEPRSQLRPLNMVYVMKQELPSVFVHCIGDDFSLTPNLTVTSHVNTHDETVWYLGGELAESGVGKTDSDQIGQAQQLTKEMFPWIDFDGADWRCFTINRAEAKVNNNFRPDDAFFVEENRVIAAWPTKLTLTPSLADTLIENFESAGIIPLSQNGLFDLSTKLRQPELARAYWD